MSDKSSASQLSVVQFVSFGWCPLKWRDGDFGVPNCPFEEPGKEKSQAKTKFLTRICVYVIWREVRANRIFVFVLLSSSFGHFISRTWMNGSRWMIVKFRVERIGRNAVVYISLTFKPLRSTGRCQSVTMPRIVQSPPRNCLTSCLVLLIIINVNRGMRHRVNGWRNDCEWRNRSAAQRMNSVTD